MEMRERLKAIDAEVQLCVMGLSDDEFYSIRKAVADAIAACADGGWRTMETALADVRVLLVNMNRQVVIGYPAETDTHWQPLPLPPKEAPDA